MFMYQKWIASRIKVNVLELSEECKSPQELPSSTKVFDHQFEDVVKGYLKFALKPENNCTASVVTITKESDNITYARTKT